MKLKLILNIIANSYQTVLVYVWKIRIKSVIFEEINVVIRDFNF